jgi:predicted transcriptional regulator of viral defense system
MHYEGSKTLGPQMARLVTGLHDEGRDVFTLQDVGRITEASPSAAASLISNAVKRGVVTRIKRGNFILVPYELGSQTVYTGDPLIVGHRLLGDHPHFVSHGSAMAVHGMTTQPRMVTQFSCVAPPRSFMSHGVEFQFISRKPEHMFGMSDTWVTPQQRVPVSDIERTIIDGLDMTAYVGGYTEIDKGAWMRHLDVNPDKLVDYALRLGSGAVIRRLGFLLDSCNIGSDHHRAALRERLTATYHLLDPLLHKEGPYQSRWRLQINVDPE